MTDEVQAVPTPQPRPESFEQTVKKRQREIERRKGPIRRAIDLVMGLASDGVAEEARDDWLRVRRVCDAINARRATGEGITNIEIDRLATATAFLEVARKTRDLAETWALINQASETLCEVASHDEKRMLLLRLENSLENLKQWLKERYEDEAVAAELQVKLEATTEPCERLSIYSQHWHLINDWIAFSRRLWLRALLILIFTLGLAIAVAEYLYADNFCVAIEHPFIFIAAIGLFGGALSAMLTASTRKVSAVNYGQSITQLIIRLVLGACGAFVVYVLLNVPDLFDQELQAFFSQSVIGFVALGIVAGFSEQLFRGQLEKLAKQFPQAQPKPKQNADSQ